MAVLAKNKRAFFDYEIKDKYEAGIALLGHEVKSVKTGHVSLKGAFVTIKSSGPNPEMYLTNAFIPLYKKATTISDYSPERPRKLLLKKKEISHLIGKKQEQGLTLVPIKIYTKRNLIKLEFGIGRGKKKYDKREDIKKRDVERDMRMKMKNVL
jgi:SsrA-binding protein